MATSGTTTFESGFYIDDVIKKFIELIDSSGKTINPSGYTLISPSFKITLGELAKQLYAFKKMIKYII